MLTPFLLATGCSLDVNSNYQTAIKAKSGDTGPYLDQEEFTVAIEELALSAIPVVIAGFFGGVPLAGATIATSCSRFACRALFEKPLKIFLVSKSSKLSPQQKQILRVAGKVVGTLVVNTCLKPTSIPEMFFSFSVYWVMKASSQLTLRYLETTKYRNNKIVQFTCCKLVESGTQIACYKLIGPLLLEASPKPVQNREISKSKKIVKKSPVTIIPSKKTESHHEAVKRVDDVKGNIRDKVSSNTKSSSPIKFQSCEESVGTMVTNEEMNHLMEKEPFTVSAVNRKGVEIFDKSCICHSQLPSKKAAAATRVFELVKQKKITLKELCKIQANFKSSGELVSKSEHLFHGEQCFEFSSGSKETMACTGEKCEVSIRACTLRANAKDPAITDMALVALVTDKGAYDFCALDFKVALDYFGVS